MTHSYLAFIDESGDDGLDKFREPGGRGGSSSWLILSACLFRQTHSLDAVKWRDEITSNFTEKRKRDLHFAELKHEQRVVAASILGSKPIRALSVLAAKRPIPPDIYTEKNQLYFYMTRYLVERLSWLCRDLRPRVPEGDGRVAITFSRRGGMSYESFRDYLSKLKGDADSDIRIHWPVIDIEAVDARDHSGNASLQLVDTIASSFACAVEPNIYGNCETRYTEALKPVTYERNGNYLSYGVKFVPRPEGCSLSAEQLRLVDLFKN